jgi:uncharacterized protein
MTSTVDPAVSPRYVRPSSKMLPEVTPESEAFWTGGQRGELLIYRCRSCGRFFHPPTPACFRCQSRDVGPERTSGRAKVAARTLDVHPWFEGWPPPYLVVLVELDDEPDVRLTTNIVDCAFEDVYIGMPVEVTFEHWADELGEVWLPLFRPAGAEGTGRVAE